MSTNKRFTQIKALPKKVRNVYLTFCYLLLPIFDSNSQVCIGGEQGFMLFLHKQEALEQISTCPRLFFCMFWAYPSLTLIVFTFFFYRVLYMNKITSLPTQVFHGLTSLQLLLMNSNKIKCIRKDSFRDLRSVNLL